MKQKEFIKVLNKEGYSYKIEGDKLVVTHKDNVELWKLKTLPPGVEFRNKGDVYLNSLTSLPHGVEFENDGNVILDSLTSLPPGFEFRNNGRVYLKSLIGGWFENWEGNIEGINNKRLLNLMISKGVFI